MRYLLDPGSFQDVRIVDPHEATKLVGILYRTDGNRLWYFDRVVAQWFEHDAESQQRSVAIKVLRAAGLHP